MIINPNNYDKKSLYYLLTGLVVPRPIALVATKNKDDSINIAPFSYFNLVTIKPVPRIAISIAKKPDLSLKDTAVNIQANKQFRVHIVSESILHSMNETATNLSYGESELTISDFSMDPLDETGLKIKEAKASFYCELEQIIPFEASDLYIARILDINIDDSIVNDDETINILSLKPVGRLAKDDYSIIKDTLTVRRKIR